MKNRIIKASEATEKATDAQKDLLIMLLDEINDSIIKSADAGNRSAFFEFPVEILNLRCIETAQLLVDNAKHQLAEQGFNIYQQGTFKDDRAPDLKINWEK